MNPEALLSQLRPNHAPEPISWWPPAPGWWLLAGVIILVIVIIVWRRRSSVKRPWRSSAMKSFNQAIKQYQTAPGSDSLQNLNIILKRIYASARNDANSMSMSGQAWAECLQHQFGLGEELSVLLSEGHYQVEPPQIDDRHLLYLRKQVGEFCRG